MDEAICRDFFSARHQSAPRLVERELRGVMRLCDSRGCLLLATICELEYEGAVVDFAMPR
jgi:hypothetical protein